MTDETPEETFRRLCGEMGVSDTWNMSRHDINGLNDEQLAQRGLTYTQAMQLAAVRERMEVAEAETTTNRSTGLHPIWAAANKRLLARRAGNNGDDHARL